MINTAAPLSFCTSDSHYISTELLPSLKYVSDAEKHLVKSDVFTLRYNGSNSVN